MYHYIYSALLLLLPRVDRRAQSYEPDIQAIADCTRCRRFVTYYMANRMAVHLAEEHGLTTQETHQTIDHVFSRLLEHVRQKRQDESQVR